MGDIKPKKCLICGRYFVPDRRVGERQKVCSREKCQKERKRLAQFKWCRKNPTYFADRSEYVRHWRQNRTSRAVSGEIDDDHGPRARKKTARKKGPDGNGWYKG